MVFINDFGEEVIVNDDGSGDEESDVEFSPSSPAAASPVLPTGGSDQLEDSPYIPIEEEKMDDDVLLGGRAGGSNDLEAQEEEKSEDEGEKGLGQEEKDLEGANASGSGDVSSKKKKRMRPLDSAKYIEAIAGATDMEKLILTSLRGNYFN